jgi:hypothetical protein
MNFTTPCNEINSMSQSFLPRYNTMQAEHYKKSPKNLHDSSQKLIITLRVKVYFVRFQVLTAANTKMAVCWAVAPRGLVEIYRAPTGTCFLHQGDLIARLHGATTRRNTAIGVYFVDVSLQGFSVVWT